MIIYTHSFICIIILNNYFTLIKKSPIIDGYLFLGIKKILAISYFNIAAIVGVKVLNFCVRDGYRWATLLSSPIYFIYFLFLVLWKQDNMIFISFIKSFFDI